MNLDDLTKAQLVDYAGTVGCDVKAYWSKPDLIECIERHIEAVRVRRAAQAAANPGHLGHPGQVGHPAE